MEKEFTDKAKKLVSQMTVEEKCSQMKYNADAVDRLGIPEYNWWNEGLHGVARSGTATVFPQAIALAATFSTKWIFKAAKVIATEARAKYNIYQSGGDRDIYKGLTLWSPNINIFRDPRWGRGQETYGEDPYLTYRLGENFVNGIQGKEKYWTAAACLKHFAAHSGPENLRHGFNAIVSKKDLEETYLFAFRKIIENTDVAGVMGAYNMVNGEPACGSETLTNILRNKWNFDGYFTSDCFAIRDFHEKIHITKTPVESVTLAVKNQCDLNCGCTYEHLIDAYNAGYVCDEEINKSVIRLMAIRYKLGMFDVTELDNLNFESIDNDKNKQVNLECARRSVVLLKNDGILPLDESKIKTIAVIGPNANRKEALEGNYCGTSSEYITFLEGIKKRFSGKVIFASGCDLTNNRTEPLAKPDDRLVEAVAAAKYADVSILFLGLDSSIEGEQGDAGNSEAAGDKINLRYPAPQQKLIDAISIIGKPFIIVTASGSAMNPETDNDNARLQCWYNGAMGGTAVAELLFGDVSPSGKLPVTFYKDSSKLPDFSDYSMKNRTYRYLEDNSNVLYGFGFGLTYGDIRITDIDFKKISSGICLKLTAFNFGERDTEDVIQCYIKSNSKFSPPNPVLCGFQRIFLEKGQKKNILVNIEREAFTIVNNDGKRFLPMNVEYKIFADTKQPDKSSKFVTFKI